MKVVIFCGGMGLRMREASQLVPKPMVTIGGRPLLWHLMSYYAHYGHRDFVLCTGYKGEVIEAYFRDAVDGSTEVYVLDDGSERIEIERPDMSGWSVTLVNTGLEANIAQRLLAARPHLEGEEMFLANYGDVLSDVDLDALVAAFEDSGRTAGLVCVRPPHTFHVVEMGAAEGMLAPVTTLGEFSRADVWINGGFFTLRPAVFDAIEPGEELVERPFQRLAGAGELLAHRHDGFWVPMDSLKDRQHLEDLWEAGADVWSVWRGQEPEPRAEVLAR